MSVSAEATTTELYPQDYFFHIGEALFPPFIQPTHNTMFKPQNHQNKSWR